MQKTTTITTRIPEAQKNNRDIDWINFENYHVRNAFTKRLGWVGINPRYAWPNLRHELDPYCPGFTLKKTLDPPPPNPPISIIAIFGDAGDSVKETTAQRISSNFGYYHLDLRKYILELVKHHKALPMEAFKAGLLGSLHPEALVEFVEEAGIWAIPSIFLVDILRNRVDALVREGRRRFVMTSYPDHTEAVLRFMGMKGSTGISAFKCVVWLLSNQSNSSENRKSGINYFYGQGTGIVVDNADTRTADDVYGELMGSFYDKARMAGGFNAVPKQTEVIDLCDEEMEESSDGGGVKVATKRVEAMDVEPKVEESSDGGGVKVAREGVEAMDVDPKEDEQV